MFKAFVISTLSLVAVICADFRGPSAIEVVAWGVRTANAQPAASTTGPKKRIAVAKFDGSAAAAQFGGWDIGSGLAAQLTTALVESDQFIVIERSELASVLREQEMGLQRIVSRETAAQVSGVLGAQLLVNGVVTQFDQRAGGGGLRLGIGSGSIGGGLGGTSVNAVIGMDLRLVDTTTGQIIQVHKVEQKASATALSADINVKQVAFGGDVFNKTPLGQATRQAITQAAALIVRSMQRVPWSGRVVEVAGDEVYVNAGSATGVKPGDIFTVSVVLRQLTDPDSGALLGIVEDRLGEIEIVSVQEKFGVARMVSPFQTKRGDLVKAVAR